MSQDIMLGELAQRGELDHYARLVRQFVHVPVALVTLIEPQRQVFLGALGLAEPLMSTRQTPLSYSFCQYVVADDAPLVVSDARLDPRLADNDAIVDLDVVAYAGWPVRDGAGRTIGSLCAIDHSPREWTETELAVLQDLAQACSAEVQAALRMARDSEHIARTIFDAVDVAMAFYDHDGRLVMANDLAERAGALAGFRLDQPPYAGDHVRRADNRTSIPFEDQIIPRALRGDVDTQEMEWVGPPGRQLAVVASAQKVDRADGSPWGTVIAAHDVTDLARALQVKDEVVATVSHELRTPLTAMVGHIVLLEDELESPNEMALQSMQAITRSAERLYELIADLLQVADRRRLLDLRSTDVTALLEQVVSGRSAAAQTAGLEIAIDQQDGVQHAVIDQRRMIQAVENLVDNAIAYTPAGGRVLVACSGDHDAVDIVVRDSGNGMTPDEVAQAFDTFWRADDVRRAAVPGVGLGLSLVHDIVAAHRGTVDLDSTPGEGTRVTLRVPRAGDGTRCESAGPPKPRSNP